MIPLFVAATNKCPDCLATLLKAGANPNDQAGDGFTALMMATRSGLVEQVKLLLDAGASMYQGSDMFGRGALELAEFQASGQGGIRMSEGESLESAQKRFRDVYELLKTRA